jgi:hypothetical protein
MASAAAKIIPFPHHGGPFVVRVVNSIDGWLVTYRGHGWIYATRSDAIADAIELAEGHGVDVMVEAT